MKLLRTIRNTLAGLAIAAGIFLLGVIGAVEQDQITYRRFCACAAAGIAGLAIGVVGSNLLSNEINWRSKR